MTLRIKSDFDGQTTTIRLIGQVRSEHLESLKGEIEAGGPQIVLNLDETTIVDVNVVRFLGECEDHGIEVVNSPPYILEWIRRERKARARGQKEGGEVLRIRGKTEGTS
jgi:hypothetical protein